LFYFGSLFFVHWQPFLGITLVISKFINV